MTGKELMQEPMHEPDGQEPQLNVDLGNRHQHTHIEMVGVREAAIRTSRARMFLTASVFSLLFLTIVVRLLFLAVSEQAAEPRAERRSRDRIEGLSG